MLCPPNVARVIVLSGAKTILGSGALSKVRKYVGIATYEPELATVISRIASEASQNTMVVAATSDAETVEQLREVHQTYQKELWMIPCPQNGILGKEAKKVVDTSKL